MSTPVLLPAGLVRLGAERTLFPEARGLNPVGGHSGRYQCVLDRAGTAVAERQVVFSGTALVAVSLNGEGHVRMLLQECSVRLDNCLLVAAHIRLVVIKVDV